MKTFLLTAFSVSMVLASLWLCLQIIKRELVIRRLKSDVKAAGENQEDNSNQEYARPNEIYLDDKELAFVVRELRHSKKMLMRLMVRREHRDSAKLQVFRLETLDKMDRIISKLAGRAKA